MRYILLRKIILIEDDRVIAQTTFSGDDEYLQDHFPGCPVVPGALLTEAMAQAGGWIILYRLDFAAWPLLTMIEGAKFRDIVRPGEELTIKATLEASARSDYRVKVTAESDGSRVADARFFYHAFEKGSADWLPDGLDEWSRAILVRLRDASSSSLAP
jgi:3-hydroxymyristoyl/3-hydroxydecanoyl-(acyl carrier protein) dehydratase